MERVSVVGAGYVGLVSGVCLSHLGHNVTCVDIDASRVERINRGQCPVQEPGLTEMLHGALEHGRFAATEDLRAAVRGSAITLLAVGTPAGETGIDLAYVREAAAQIGRALRDKAGYHTVAVKSTVVPGTTDGVVLPLLRQHSGKMPGEDFGAGVNPEFLREGRAVADFMNPDRIVVAGSDARARQKVEDLYAVFHGVEIIRTNNRTAEMIKYASNALLATLISFSNEIANLCDRYPDLDAMDVMHGVHLDRRLAAVSEDGRRVRPDILSYLLPGCGFGGSCLPKDLEALVAEARRRGYDPALLQSVAEVNAGQPQRLVGLLRRHFDTLAGRRVGVLGLAFKPGTDDVRDSPALRVIDLLRRESATVIVYDPLVTADGRGVPAGVTVAEDLEGLARTADALVLVTSWAPFKALEEIVPQLARQPVVVDGRRFFEKAAFRLYEGIGLGSACASGEGGGG